MIMHGSGALQWRWLHLEDKEITASCMSCHLDIHSSRTASNTGYRWRVNGSGGMAWKLSVAAGQGGLGGCQSAR